MNADFCFRSFSALLKDHVGDKDDVVAIIRQDDVDSLNTYLVANGMAPEQCTDGYDQGLFQLAAKYDAVSILNFLLHQSENLANEGYARFLSAPHAQVNFDSIAIAYEHRSMRALLLLLQKAPSGAVANYLMSRFSLFEQPHLEYDSLLYIPSPSTQSSATKQFAQNLAQFNATYRNIQSFAVNSKLCLFVNNHTAFLGHARLDAVSIHAISLPESVLAASLGNRHALLLTQSGRVFASGSEGVLQGRTQYLDTSLHFTPLPALSAVSQVLCGAAHSLALTTTGDLFGWGENACGQLPGCSAPFVATPQLLASDVTHAAVYGDHSAYACAAGIFFFPSYRSGSGIAGTARTARVNTLYFLQLRVAQLACHEGFDTLLTDRGQLFAYFYLDARGDRSPAARALFPASLDPGCIFALLPSRTVCRVASAPGGCIAHTAQGQAFFLGARKAAVCGPMDPDGRLDALGGHVEVLATDAQRGVFCRLLRCVPRAVPHTPTTLVELCAARVRTDLPLRSLVRGVALAKTRGSAVLMAALLELVAANIVELLFFFPAALQDLASAVTSLPARLLNPSEEVTVPETVAETVTETSQEAILERVFKRVRALRKRIEKAGQTVAALRTRAVRLDDAVTVVSRQELAEEFAAYVRVARALRRVPWPASEEAQQRLQWLCEQDAVGTVSATVNSNANSSANTTANSGETQTAKASAPKKKKKKAKTTPLVAPVAKEEKKEEAKKEEETGFTVVKKGAVVGTVLEKGRPSPMSSLFEESTEEEEDVQVAAAMAIDDDLAWEGLSQEEIANQKILLAYYKQQKDRKEKRKETKRGKKQKRK